jgi:hypothetical protein
MLDRTTFDLRIAEHQAIVTRTNRRGWTEAAGTTPRVSRVARAALAGMLMALARQRDPAVGRDRTSGQDAAPTQ